MVKAKIKNIIIGLILVLAVCLIPVDTFGLPANEGNDWKTYFSKYDSVTIGLNPNSKNKYSLVQNNSGSDEAIRLYCVQHGGALKSDETNEYELQDTIRFWGNKSVYDGTYSAVTIDNSEVSATMAYCLIGGTQWESFATSWTSSTGSGYTTRQRMIYSFWNEWAERYKAKKGSYYDWTAENNDSYAEEEQSLKDNADTKTTYSERNDYLYVVFYKNIQRYVNNKAPDYLSSVSAEFDTNTENTFVHNDKNNLIGPFTVTFTGQTCQVSVTYEDGTSNYDMKLYDANGNEYKIPSIKVDKSVQYKSTQFEEDEIHNYKEYNNKRTITFYLKNDYSSDISKIRFKTTAKSYYATVYLLKSGTTTIKDSTKQKLIAVNKDDEFTISDSDIIDINVKHKTNVVITKTDKDSGERLEGIGFTIQKKSDLKYIKADGTTTATRTILYTNSNGQIRVNGIDITSDLNDKLLIVEADSKNEYYTVDLKNSASLSVKDSGTVTCSFKNIKLHTNIDITKVDEDTQEPVQGILFTIYDEKTGKYIIDTEGNEGTTKTVFKTDANGKIQINGIEYKKSEKPTFKITEVGCENEYYSVQAENTSTVDADNNGTVEVTFKNKKNLSVSGYVWLDTKNNKNSEYNSLYDEGEQTIEGVNVNLKTKDGKVVATVKTDASGKYIFDHAIPYYEKQNYYIEFNYSDINGGQYKKYIPVKYMVDNSLDKSSKAIAEKIPEYDSDLPGIAMTYKGTEKESDYGLSGKLFECYNKDNNTIENINLGIMPLYDPEYEISEDLKYVRIEMGEYSYIYEYGAKEFTDSSAVPTVQYGNKTDVKAYSRPFYPSDIIAHGPKGSNTLKVYVIYEIAIKNTTTYNREYEYKEEKLYIDSLTNSFDTSRYILSNDSGEDSSDALEKDISGYFHNWSINEQTTEAVYNWDNDKEREVNSGEAITKYIRFRVTDNAILDILNKKETIEEHPTNAITWAHHQYKRIDYSWNNDIVKEQTHRTQSKMKESAAPYMIFELGKDRTINGNVFEDTDIANDGDGVVLGDGIYNNAENVLKNVTVELIDSSGNLVKVYGQNSNGESVTKDAKDITNEKGEYSIAGVVPGKYYLSYTYADGTTEIYDASGNKVDKTVTMDEYKSTIVSSEVAKNALKGENNPYGAEWYKYINDNDTNEYSVAVDNLNIRSNYNTDNSSETSMKSSTALIDITIENTKENIMKVDEVNTPILQESDFKGLNFGIITQPKQRAQVEKFISNIRMANDPNVIIDGNPAGTVMGVKNLDVNKDSLGSRSVLAEIKQELIYGSRLTLTYKMRVTNTSDVNYYETDEKHYGWYYWFGETGSYSKEILLNVENVVDAYDVDLTYVSDNANVIKLTYSTTTGWRDSSNTKYDVNDTIDRIKAYVDKINEGSANSEKEEIRENEVLLISGFEEVGRNKQTESVAYDMEKVLSTDDDLRFINIVAINSIKNSKSEDDTNNNPTQQPPVETPSDKSLKIVIKPEVGEPAKADAVVSAPTGDDKQSIVIYASIGLVILLILGTAIVIIKIRQR